ncbi:MAG: hypothetical protein AAFQ89_02965 [Cyanobacteria bacterium J06626_18]
MDLPGNLMPMFNYYPWNTRALADWLELEMTTGRSLDELAEDLRVPRKLLREWLRTASPSIWSTITLDQVQSIAHYRDWSLDEVAAWLDIGTAHLIELKEMAELQR